MVGKMISLQSYLDNTGCLVPIEYPETIPFEAGRLFYITDVIGKAERGNHASMNAQFAFIALNGSINIKLDDGFNRETYCLNSKTDMLIAEKRTWIVADSFTKDAILLVISDKKYNDCEYIGNYLEFKRLIEVS